MDKSVTLVIRCHGHINVTWNDDSAIRNQLGDIVDLFDPNIYCVNFNIVSLARLGDICYGDPNLLLWVKLIKEDYNHLIKNMNMEEFLNYFFINPNESVRILNQETLGRNGIPELTKELQWTINKYYTNDIHFDCRIECLHTTGLTRGEQSQLQKLVRDLTTQLKNMGITRKQILENIHNKLRKVHLTLCDLTCDSFIFTPTSERNYENGTFRFNELKWLIDSLYVNRRDISKQGNKVWIKGMRGGRYFNKKKTKKHKNKTYKIYDNKFENN